MARRHEESANVYAETLRNAEARFGIGNPKVAVQRQSLANQLFYLKRYQEAEDILRRAVETFRRAFGDKHVRVGHALFDLAWTFYQQNKLADLQNKLTDLDQILIESHAIFASTPSLDGKYGPDGWQTLAVQGSLANYYINEVSRPADGEPLYAEVMAGWERRGETSRWEYAVAVANRVTARIRMSPPLLDDETERLAKLAFESCRESKPNVLGTTAFNYHVVLMWRRRFELVEPMWRECLLHVPGTPATHGFIAQALVNLGRLDEAESELLLAAGGDASKVNPGYAGMILLQRGRHAEAEPLLRKAVESAGYTGMTPYSFRSALGECLMHLGRFEEAHTPLVMAHATVQRQFQSNWMVDEADQRLSRFYAAWGKNRAEAEPAARAKALAELEAATKPKPPG